MKCAHCQGRVIRARTAEQGTYTGRKGTWTHIAKHSELAAGLEWCDTPEPGHRPCPCGEGNLQPRWEGYLPVLYCPWCGERREPDPYHPDAGLKWKEAVLALMGGPVSDEWDDEYGEEEEY